MAQGWIQAIANYQAPLRYIPALPSFLGKRGVRATRKGSGRKELVGRRSPLPLRKTLLLPLDDLLAVIHERLNPAASRSGLRRCLRRHKVSDLKLLREQQAAAAASSKPESFKDHKPGFIHVDVKYLPEMPDEKRREYMFAAIDRATRSVNIETHHNKSAKTAKGFLQRLIDKMPFPIIKILTANGKEFTDRFRATGERKPTGRHLFDRLCNTHHIQHRLTKA